MLSSVLSGDYVDGIGNIEREAQRLLGRDNVEGLKQWYLEALDPRWDYVAFVVRRSYLLALIMEEITGKKMEEHGNTEVLTDASLFLHCEQMAECYRETGEFPRILIKDDVLIHGRNINHLLRQLEDRMTDLLPDQDAEQVKEDLSDAIRIHVYIRADTCLLLNSRYDFKLSYSRKESQKEWRSTASNISALILRCNMANASYIYSEILDEAQFKKINLKKYIKTIYHGTEEYTYVRLVGRGAEKKAVFTLRIVKGFGSNQYRVIPFVFLPNLPGDATNALLEEVLRGIVEPKFRKCFQRLDGIWGKRSYNELLTLVFSNVLLQEFNSKYEFKKKTLDQNEIRKLARNYNLSEMSKTKNLLNNLLNMKLFDTDGLAELLDNGIPDEFMVMKVTGEKNHTFKEICERLERYFYNCGYEEEKEAIELSRDVYFNTAKHAKRKARGCCFVLKDMNADYTQEDAKINMAYFLQMMDAGILGLSSYAPNNVHVVGMAQYAKAGEMALYLYPLKNYLYIPLLAKMQYECEKWRTSLTDEIKKYWRQLPLKSEEISEDAVLQFVEKLGQIGQTPKDWDENYLARVNFEVKDFSELFDRKMDLVVRQQELVDAYMKLKA